MDTAQRIIIDGRHCAAWRVSTDRWHASAWTRSQMCVMGHGADARTAASSAARFARLLDEGSPAEIDAALAELRASLT